MDAGKLGFGPDTVIQELGWDEDVDEELRVDVERHTGNDLVDGDIGDDVDGVILWWRDGDGDLVDALVDSLTDLVDGGSVWLLTPKVGRDNYVPGADVVEAARGRRTVGHHDVVGHGRLGCHRLTAHKR